MLCMTWCLQGNLATKTSGTNRLAGNNDEWTFTYGITSLSNAR
jgi:hypothetical protein